MAKRSEDFRVVNIKYLNELHFILELEGTKPLPEIKPGQFAQIRIDNSKNTFLRRPFSIHDVDYAGNRLKFLIRAIGDGTRTLGTIAENRMVNLIYPLGNSFSLPLPREKVLLVGGGCGIAPLLYLAKFMNRSGVVPDILLGFRNSKSIMESDEYSKTGRLFIITEDGSEGEKGLVTGHTIMKDLGAYGRVFCCGPEPMMKAVAELAKASGTECEVSLENMMACGIGVCLCCVVKSSRGNVCTCTDGPVFNIKDLQW
ncbi:MAG TPA: dihydroorotate dehydrogenase electron transfer subunit [Bacteroidales bacterium]|nr:dihydroorotate dehydrogenase electron transfer subunit [Bacteroidales bacterium]HQG56919.1 dihydroorotate dehydrogenase electron transfer subunit [Bacteroidales bacterium]HRT90394.1 dihydroorotate dehydrogenase electron transfer subunit [Bacteroidales bacterium]